MPGMTTLTTGLDKIHRSANVAGIACAALRRGAKKARAEILVGDKSPESVTLPHTLVVRSSTAANRRPR